MLSAEIHPQSKLFDNVRLFEKRPVDRETDFSMNFEERKPLLTFDNWALEQSSQEILRNNIFSVNCSYRQIEGQAEN